AKVQAPLADNAIGLLGECRLGPKVVVNRAANSTIRLPWQPGLLREVRRHEPDVLISDGFFQWTAVALWLRRQKGVPHVVCYERTAHTERNCQWYRRIYRGWALRYVDAMCCNGALCGVYAPHMGMPANRITYGHMVADTEGLKAAVSVLDPHQVNKLRNTIGATGVCLLYVGQLIPRKGLRELLTALSLVASTHRSQFSLLIVGDGPQRQELQDLCSQQGLSNVFFVGPIDYDNLAQYYALADAFIIPTLEDNWSLV